MTIGLGIVGLAHGHVISYMRQWFEHPQWGVRPCAMWDRDVDRVAETGKQFPSLQAEASLEALLAREDITAVIVGSETSHHADDVEKATGAGKAIILQKPMATTLADARRIVQAVEKTGVPFTLAWQMRVDPQHEQIKKLIQGNTLGRVTMLRRRHGLPTQSWPDFANSWHASPTLNHSMWADDAAHPIDWLLWLLGEPQSVIAQVNSPVGSELENGQGAAIFQYKDGLLAIIECCFTTLAGVNTTEIIGSEGTLIQDYGDLPSCNAPRKSGTAGLRWYTQQTGQWTESDIPSPTAHGSRISDLAQPLADFLHGRRPAIASAKEGLTALAMLLASYESANTGRRITLSEFTDNF